MCILGPCTFIYLAILLFFVSYHFFNINFGDDTKIILRLEDVKLMQNDIQALYSGWHCLMINWSLQFDAKYSGFLAF